MTSIRTILLSAVCLTSFSSLHAAEFLVEAESFNDHGGWKLDTQFITEMGSPYLLAHGLGTPVKNAETTVEAPAAGKYRILVRTKDWVAQWDAKGAPGKFQLLINGSPVETTFGVEGKEWSWHDGGWVDLPAGKFELAIKDLTGFDGRCDAIYFTQDEDFTPPNEGEILPGWRRKLLGLEAEPTEKSGYDLVVVGGGYSGMGAALSASRMGCKVALIQNRPVLGGNGSSEVRVWAMGHIRRGRYPRVGEIIEEFCDHAKKSPGTYEEFGDVKKEEIVRAEKNIDLFLNHHAYQVDTENKRVKAVYAFDTRTSEHKRFTAPLFVDCTGHGTVGALAEAEWEMTPKGRMGMSNMWAWGEGEKEVAFPETPWALDLNMADFPYPRDHHGQWFWEGGFDKDALNNAEAIRDWNLRAVYGAFNAMKNRDGADKHSTAFLTWIAFVGGPRESRRLMGDVVLTQDDIIEKREFKDGCVPSTWSIDLHYPKQQYAEKYPDNPFISYAVHDRRIDRAYGYPVPYRCFYSKNIENLFMAGRCVSVTHQALGTVRVMKTCGMMGEVVGRAASICIKQDCLPRDVYHKYWPEMESLLKLPGKARRDTVHTEIVIPNDAMELASSTGPMSGLNPAKMPGIVIDDEKAKKTGKWTKGEGLKGYVGNSYLYAGGDASITFNITPEKGGVYDLRVAYLKHENRSTGVPVTIRNGEEVKTVRINMTEPAPLTNDFISVGQYKIEAGKSVSITITTEGADSGNVHADAVQAVLVKE